MRVIVCRINLGEKNRNQVLKVLKVLKIPISALEGEIQHALKPAFEGKTVRGRNSIASIPLDKSLGNQRGRIMPDFSDIALGIQIIVTIALAMLTFRLNRRVDNLNRKLDQSLQSMYRFRDILIKAQYAGLMAGSTHVDKSKLFDEFHIQSITAISEMQGIAPGIDTQLEELTSEFGKLVLSLEKTSDYSKWGGELSRIAMRLHFRLGELIKAQLEKL